MSLELAKTISDASYRDAALRHIIELCMTANDLGASRTLVQGVQSEPMRTTLSGVSKPVGLTGNWLDWHR